MGGGNEPIKVEGSMGNPRCSVVYGDGGDAREQEWSGVNTKDRDCVKHIAMILTNTHNEAANNQRDLMVPNSFAVIMQRMRHLESKRMHSLRSMRQLHKSPVSTHHIALPWTHCRHTTIVSWERLAMISTGHCSSNLTARLDWWTMRCLYKLPIILPTPCSVLSPMWAMCHQRDRIAPLVSQLATHRRPPPTAVSRYGAATPVARFYNSQDSYQQRN